MKTDFLIVGSGIAGLSLGLYLSDFFPERKITICTKTNEEETNTRYAQGGIAVVLDENDSYRKHIDDTMNCGHSLSNFHVVELVVKEAPNRLLELENWGFVPDKDKSGKIILGKEGGHSDNRIVHSKDKTGLEIEKSLLVEVGQRNNIEILNHYFVTDLLSKDEMCFGAKILHNEGKLDYLFSSYTILATGGIGQIYGHTTNPSIATGDGIAMAKNIGAKISNMEFIQFHPTALFSKELKTTFLISEALRGFGAILKNSVGEKFMEKYDSRGDLAPRDIVSKAIIHELKQSKSEFVWLDCTHLTGKGLKEKFPTIYNKCLETGIDLTKDWIPVAPAQHYLCGGISVNKKGRTNIKRLYACGECSDTGLHGANRLASNSLLEALVFSHEIAQNIKENFKPLNRHFEIDRIVDNNKLSVSVLEIQNIKLKLQKIMMKNVGILRNKESLMKTFYQLEDWKTTVENEVINHQLTKELLELRNMIIVGETIVEQSIQRKESIGTFQLQVK